MEIKKYNYSWITTIIFPILMLFIALFFIIYFMHIYHSDEPKGFYDYCCVYSSFGIGLVIIIAFLIFHSFPSPTIFYFKDDETITKTIWGKVKIIRYKDIKLVEINKNENTRNIGIKFTFNDKNNEWFTIVSKKIKDFFEEQCKKKNVKVKRYPRWDWKLKEFRKNYNQLDESEKDIVYQIEVNKGENNK